jgi:hypothetical protein
MSDAGASDSDDGGSWATASSFGAAEEALLGAASGSDSDASGGTADDRPFGYLGPPAADLGPPAADGPEPADHRVPPSRPGQPWHIPADMVEVTGFPLLPGAQLPRGRAPAEGRHLVVLSVVDRRLAEPRAATLFEVRRGAGRLCSRVGSAIAR